MNSKIALLLTFALAVLVGCGRREGIVQEEPQVLSVVATEALRESGREKRLFSGIIAAEEELVMAFRVAGQVKTLFVKPGDSLRLGEPLVELDSIEYELEQVRAQASYNSVKAQYEANRSTYERIRELYQRDNASRSQLESALLAFEGTSANLAAAEAQKKRADLQLSYTSLYAPFRGTVDQIYIDEGEIAAAGQGILLFSSGNVNGVRFSISEDVVTELRVGMETFVSIPALGAINIRGSIGEISSGSSQGSSLYSVRIVLNDPPTAMRKGLACTVTVNWDTEEDPAFLIPYRAVQEDSKGRFLFVLEKKDSGELWTVSRRNVIIGDPKEGGVEILRGLGDGDMVVTSGISEVRDGMEVQIWKETR